MKKGLKKQIEHEVAVAIEKTLSGHSAHALNKTKKAIKEASKSVGKKFVKALKALADKKNGKEKADKKKAPKASTKKAVASKKLSTKKKVAVRVVRKKISLPAKPSAPVENSTETADNLLGQN